MQNEFGVEGKKLSTKPQTKGRDPKVGDGKANLGTKVVIKRAGK